MNLLVTWHFQRGNHKGDLIFANNYGILAAVETKRGGYNPVQISKNINIVGEQAIKYRNILMEETKNDPRIITVLGIFYVNGDSRETKKATWYGSKT